jgi:hypothetical protein
MNLLCSNGTRFVNAVLVYHHCVPVWQQNICPVTDLEIRSSPTGIFVRLNFSNNTVSNSHCIVAHDLMTVNNELDGMWKEAVMDSLMYYLRIVCVPAEIRTGYLPNT